MRLSIDGAISTLPQPTAYNERRSLRDNMTLPHRIIHLPINHAGAWPAAVMPTVSAGLDRGLLRMHAQIDHWLSAFRLDPFVHRHVAMVLSDIPVVVRDDLMSDPSFHLCDYEPGPGVVMQVPMRLPGRNRASRSVVLKRTLRHRSEPFVKWLIAHEFAHAHLRHGGRYPGEDPESAADALAAEWGFPKPG
jgi:hypothetical protein